MRKIIAAVLVSAGLLFAGIGGVSANEGLSECSSVAGVGVGHATGIVAFAQAGLLGADINPGQPPFIGDICNPS